MLLQLQKADFCAKGVTGDTADFAAIESVLEEILSFYEEICGLLGFLKPEEKVENGFDDEKIEALLAERAAAKKEKNYARADEIRALLTENGIVIEDTPAGAKWHRA